MSPTLTCTSGTYHAQHSILTVVDNFRLFHTPWFYRFPFKLRTIPSTAKGELSMTGPLLLGLVLIQPICV